MTAAVRLPTSCISASGRPKVRYRTETEALLRARWQKEQWANAMRVYFCGDCGGYHLAKARRDE